MLFSDSSDTLSVLSVCVLSCLEKWPFSEGFSPDKLFSRGVFLCDVFFVAFFLGVFPVTFSS